MPEIQRRAVLARSLLRKKNVKVPRVLTDKKYNRPRIRLVAYFYKMRGASANRKKFALSEVLWSGFGAVIGMCALVLLDMHFWNQETPALLLGSFGASAVLIFGAPELAASQPRNVIGGHVLSAFMGVFAQNILGTDPWLAAVVAVSGAVMLMLVTSTMHPPGGATALTAVVGASHLKVLGYSYALVPVGVSVLVLVATGILINNMSNKRKYPLYWL